MNIKKLTGNRIVKEREKQGLSQEDLADLAGFPIPYISKVERGIISVGIFNLQKITNALNVKICELLSGH